MKIKTLTILFFFFALSTHSQFSVLKIQGDVFLQTQNRQLKIGDKISDKDILIFGSMRDKISLFHSEKGCVQAIPKTSMTVMLMDVLVVNNQRDTLRKMGSDLSVYFCSDSIIIIGEVLQKRIPFSYKMSEKSFFRIEMIYGEAEILTDLKFNEDTLLISRNDIYKVDNQEIDKTKLSKVQLFYRISSKYKTAICRNLRLIFLDKTQIQKSTDVIVAEMRKAKLSDTEITKLVCIFLNQNYGIPDEANFHNWIFETYQLKKE